MDPDSGGKPPEGGASAAMRKEGRSSRRRKAKRNGKNRTAAQGTNAAQADSSLQAGRPETRQRDSRPLDARLPEARSPDSRSADAKAEDRLSDAHPRKRKRRRARSGAPAGQPVEISDAGAPPADRAEHPHAQKSHRGRKKNRGGRGPQGRPLAAGGQGHAGSHGHNAHQGQSKSAASKPASGAGPATGRVHAHGHASGHAHGHSSSSAHQAALAASLGKNAPVREELYAALDLGTNNCRLLIAQPTRPGQFRVVDAFSRIVRLGEGLGTSRRLANDAMDRAVEALRICAAKLAHRPVRRMRLIATEACRAAENGEEFLARVRSETGLELEIIDRETEARLAVSGCSSLVGREARSVVLFDIGGGSSEIAVIRIGDNRSSRLANHITHWTSLPVGVVTLSERHGGRDVTPDVFAAMVAEVEGMLASFDCPPINLSRRAGPEDFHLIGTSGTVTTLAGVHLDLPRYDRRKVDGLWLSDDEVSAMQAKLLSWDFSDRAANPCIGPDRADLVLAGCAILEAIRRRWPSQRMRVADRGLREGLLTDMMADDGVWRRARGRRFGHSHKEEAGQAR
ncbi:Ppx/GppA phosphatase family protein [Neorhizobium alkalisoli]|uniref:Ppx/GppA phosphatase family protein n=1 Tax=Neorhizobium alkalisoli TaxID=528178 RepID=UPI003D7C339A